MTRPRVLVVGAGPAGLTLAHELQRLGADAQLIDRSIEPSPHSRALVIHCRTQELLEEAGLRQAVADRALPVLGMSMLRERRTLATIPFDLGRFTALSLPQNQTESLLASALSNLGLEVERGQELTALTQTPDGVETTVNGRSRFFDFVVGCDGAHSTVRRLLDVPFEGETLVETLWMADARIDWHLTPDRVWQLLDPQGPLTAVPMPAGLWRVVAMRTETEGEPDANFFVDAVATRIGARPALEVSWTSAFRVNCRLAASYGRDRVLLAGDAAHIHSPIGGQGMNIGMQDAFVLARLIVDTSLRPKEILARYQAQRRRPAADVIRSNARITRMAMSRGRFGRLLRDQLMPRMLSLPPIARRAGFEASGIA